MLPILLLAVAADAPKAKVNYQDNVAAIFQAKCNSCHNNDKQKGGLVLDSYGGAIKGGGSGKVIEPGDPDNSRLFLVVSHQEEPKMPPMQPKLPDADLATIKAWIAAGAPENSGSVVAATKPKADFKIDASAIGKPIGAPAMPKGLSTEPAVVSPRPNAITALAASPWAPLVAVSGHKQVLLYHATTRRLLGVLPFPEGTIHGLKFTRDGGMLLAGGGRGGQSGRVVVWDVKTGKRLFEVGKEYDAVIAADISPDRSLVALGGPSKVLRVYGTSDGELIYECKKHTEWVTAVEFSPDGVLLASGDRNGGLVVWEAPTGREFYDLRGHSAAITDVAWRLDSNVLASASEDAGVRLWEMQNGGNIKTIGAHGGGTESVRFAKDGRLVTTGRDKVAKVWDPNGNPQRQLEGFPDVATRAVFLHDDSAVVAGDVSGEVRSYELKEGKRLGNLSANPAPVAARFDQARKAHAAAESQSGAAAQALAALQADAKAKGTAAAAAQASLAAGQKEANDALAAVAAAERAAAERYAAEAVADASAWSADFARTRSYALREALVADLGARVEAAQAASTAAELTNSPRDRLIADRAEAALATTTKAADARLPSFAAAIEAAGPARAAADRATSARVAAMAPLPRLRRDAQRAANVVPARQSAVQSALAAQAAAAKAVADRTPAVQALAAQAAALKAEADALAVEKRRNDGAKAAMARAATRPTSP